MRGSARPAAAVAALTVFITLGGCRERETSRGSLPAVAFAGEPSSACAGDSLRPATAAPARGLWLYEGPSGVRVAAMVGPQRTDDKSLVVTRRVETMEVSAAGDTIRHVAGAAAVTLELLPPLGPVEPTKSSQGDSAVGKHPAAIYTVSSRVRVAAYEPCAAGSRDPRIRYVRRDATGRIVTDVLLHRTSEQ